MIGFDQPWLAPSASALAAIARPGPSFWSDVRHDPAAVLLLLRFDSVPRPPRDSAILEYASVRLGETPVGLVSWDDPQQRSHFEGAWQLARLTSALARKTGRAEESRAWCVGLLAPLASPKSFRRAARAWNLPAWLSQALSQIELPPGTLGGEGDLIAIVRLGLHLARQFGHDLGLIGRYETMDADAAVLGLQAQTLVLDSLLSEPWSVPAWQSPYDALLLPDLLAVAAEGHRLRGGATLAGVEAEVDELHAALRDQLRDEADRLRQAKLTALAEFAAGAGHEINNPLAVISGQAQYVLSHADDWLTADDEGHVAKALQTIIGQTKRIHGMLRDLMLFARPAPARPTTFDLPTLLGEVASSVMELAEGRGVRVDVTVPERLNVWADAEQVRSALNCLVKNAVEAASTGGWMRLSLEVGEAIEIHVEDSGPGPNAEQRPHLFDPFYSGRNAGRGKGFGLPVAWRLARQQGGDVRLEAQRPSRPTRFILTLPRDMDGRRAA